MPAPKRVDFYILSTTEANGRLQFACRLTEKAYNMDTQVYAHTETPADAKRLDEMLWTFRQGSFIPHEIVGESDELRAPVSIGTGTARLNEGQLLINLSNELPDFSKGFERVAEIVSADEAGRQTGRKRFKQYRDMGLQPETHDIGRG
ncbi:MAG: DNA polymerase III subunit chi [Gammaproteobacteria bacterium]